MGLILANRVSFHGNSKNALFSQLRIQRFFAPTPTVGTTRPNRHTVHPVHKLRTGVSARSILVYFTYTAVLRSVLSRLKAPTLSVLTKKSLFLVTWIVNRVVPDE
jgi:hypothetical protein